MQEIFVFGSNLAGRHGKGAARVAWQQYGAVRGRGHGHHGSSYAIPTKDAQLNTLPLRTVQSYVDMFIGYAQERQDLKFLVSAVGCGLAGFAPVDIAPMFKDTVSLSNVYLPFQFTKLLWGCTRYSFDAEGHRVLTF